MPRRGPRRDPATALHSGENVVKRVKYLGGDAKEIVMGQLWPNPKF